MTEQVSTTFTTLDAVMRHPHFARGLDDIRSGRPFNADLYDDLWAYERGRLLGAVMPLTIPLYVDGKLNPKVINLYIAAFQRGWLR